MTTDEEARAALEASSKLYYRIGEVSKLTGVKAHVLRYWETEFRWMAPPKSRSKQRLYRKRDIEFVWLLKRLLWDERYTIAGARQRIQELGVDEALALLQPTGSEDAARMDAAESPARVQRQTKQSRTDAAEEGQDAGGQASSDARSEPVADAASVGGLSPARQAEWVAFGSALGDLHAELSSIRGALHEGL